MFPSRQAVHARENRGHSLQKSFSRISLGNLCPKFCQTSASSMEQGNEHG